MEYIGTATASVLVNDCPTEEFLSRGGLDRRILSPLFYFYWQQKVSMF